MTGYNLQTLAYIQTIENLFANGRSSETEEEKTLLSDFIATQVLLTHTFGMSYLVLLWNVDTSAAAAARREELVIRRRTLIRSLDVSFHRHYKKLCESFKKARDVFLPIAPGIEKRLCACTVPSIQALVDAYNQKTEMLQKFLLRADELPMVKC